MSTYAFNPDKSKAEVYNKTEMTEALREFFDQIYPVGTIYFSTDDTNPSERFGGTWERWGAGRVPVGVSAQDSNFNTVEKTGGASTVTLTASQIPAHTHTGPSHTHSTPNHTHTVTIGEAGAHNHSVNRWQQATSTSSGTRYLAQGTTSDGYATSVNGAHTHSATVPYGGGGTTGAAGTGNTGSTGGSGAHSNLQPYITCYMWKRTA